MRLKMGLGWFTLAIIGLLLIISSEATRAQEMGIKIKGPKNGEMFPARGYGPLSSKDTLWKIAQSVRPDPRLSVYQVMIALYRANPNAFLDNNINHLKEGEYLRIPDASEMRSINLTAAINKANADEEEWAKKSPQTAKSSGKATEAVNQVQKEDLELVKNELHKQLVTIDETQQEKLTDIQKDIADSIDGLTSILQENEALRHRISKFNDQLNTLQGEVAKGQQLKVQMDSMLNLQKELLTKAQAREQELLAEKLRAEQERQNFASSPWFIATMATIPALIIVGFMVFYFRRKAKQEATETPEPVVAAPTTPEPKSEAAEDELSLDLLEHEAIAEVAEEDDLLSDELLNDDVIHLDDDLDDLDDLDDVLLDDNSEDALIDDSSDPDEFTADDLDDLLDEVDEKPLDRDNILDADDLAALLESDDDDLLEDDDLPESIDSSTDELTEDVDIDEALNIDESSADVSENLTDDDDIDALLEAEAGGSSDKVTDDDDIDALLDAAASDSSDTVTDDDDIDALLDAAASDSSDTVTDDDDIDSLLDAAASDSSETVTDEDDIDALLDAAADDSSDTVTDDDDIDALLDAEAGGSSDTVTDEDDIDALLDGAASDSSDTVTDDDDIDALLDAEAGTSSDTVTDDDDIDALLDAAADDSSDTVTDNDDIDELLDAAADDASEIVTDDDDIDALLDAAADDLSDTVTDDIDSLLDAVSKESNEELANEDDIDALLAEVSDDIESQEENVQTDSLADKFDQYAETVQMPALDEDALLAEILGDVVDSPIEEEVIEEIDNSEAINNFSEEYIAPFLSLDFSDINQDEDISDELEFDSPQDLLAEDDIDIDAILDEIGDEPNISEEGVDDDVEFGSIESAEALLQDENDGDIELDINEKVSSVEPNDSFESTIDDDDSDVFTESDNDAGKNSENEDPEFTLETDEEDDELDLSELIAEIESDNEDLSDDDISFDSLLDDSNEQDFDDEQTDTIGIDSEFDESTLAEMLSDNESIGDDVIELTPDFTDSNVLSQLLDDDIEDIAEFDKEAIEIEDIQELDSMEFDELLANIKEESNNIGSNDDDVELEPDIQPEPSFSEFEENTEDPDYVSIDSLLSDSYDTGPISSEPYDKSKIDVGLDEFPEFKNDSLLDDDDDINGINAKLDLAKVYVEIGDNDNAEVILNDIIRLGDAQQKQDAQELLDKLK